MHTHHKLIGLTALAVLIAPNAALADTGFGANAGTSGWGVEVRHDLTERIALRGSISSLTWDIDDAYDGIDYSGELEFTPAGIYVDYHPFRNGFFLSGGALIGGPGIDLTATPSGPTDIGGVTYTPAQIGTLDVASEIGDSAPFIGAGWTNARARSSGFYYSALAGVAFYGDASATMSARDGLLASDPAFLADLADEEAALEEDLSDFEAYPIVQLTAGMRF